MSDSLVSAQSFPGLVLLGIAVLASLNLFYRDRAEGEDPLHLIMTVIGRVMIVTAFVEACLVFLNFLAPVFLVILVGILIYVAFRYWLRRRSSLLAVMAAASRRWMPLAPAVRAFSCEWRGLFGRRCRRLAESLEAGAPLDQALRAEPLVPRRAAALIEAGGRSGNLAGALAETVRQPSMQPTLARVWSAAWYLAGILLAGTVSLTFIMLKIMPAYIKIFSDFDATLPAMTVVLVNACDWFAVYGWPLLLLSFLSLGCFVLLWTFDIIAWLPPPLNTLARRRETVVVLRSLALATEANQSLLPAISALAEHYPSLAMRVRLTMALGQMSLGQPWPESLADQGLLRRSELALVTSAQRVGNLPWALREVADSIERRLALRLHRWLEIIVPVLVVIVGAMVMFTIVGLFIPLVRLIERVI